MMTRRYSNLLAKAPRLYRLERRTGQGCLEPK